MVCHVCGAPSGRYPLCPSCNKARERGEVGKCAACSRWAKLAHGICAPCSGRVVTVAPEEITSWAKRLYHSTTFSRKGADHKGLFAGLKSVVDQVYEAMGAREAKAPVPVPAGTLHSWADTLSDVASAGIANAKTQDDTRAFLVAGEIAERVAGLLKLPTQVEPPARKDTPVTAVPIQRAAEPPAPATRLVTDRDIPRAVTQLIKDSKEELLIISPWIYGVDNLVQELVSRDKRVRVRIITRKPEKEDEAHRKTLHDLNKDGVDFVFTPHVHAKLIVQDGKVALVGSANLVSTSLHRNQEAAILTTDEDVVTDAHDYFNKVYLEARAQMIGL